MTGYDWITLTTDYGLSDGFTAALHGVIGRLAPRVRVLDVTHGVHAGDVARGAAVLAQAVPYLPAAVHVVVVDPGVGTGRRAVALATPDGMLVGPDNGVLPGAAEELGGILAAVSLTNVDWHLAPVSRTFHGRDIFAPVAARLAGGAPLAEAGEPVDPADLVRLPEPVVQPGPGYLDVEVLTVDRFGNVQLAARPEDLVEVERAAAGGRLNAGGLAARRGGTFADAAPGELVAYVDSAGRLALAVNGGRAVAVLGVAPGDILRIAPAAG